MNSRKIRNLVLSALRVGDDPSCAERLAAATAEDWIEIMNLARHHRLGPLLYRQLKTREDRVPAQALQTWREDYLSTAHRNTRVYHHLASLLERFNRDHIPVILLKGVYLAKFIYGNIAVRSMNDVDLLVKPADLTRVGKIMSEMDLVTYLHIEKPFSEGRHLEYKHSKDEFHVEVHWDLIESTSGIHVDLDGLWSRASPTRLAENPVYAMSPEDLLLHLCVHASDDIFVWGLRSACDIAEMLRFFEKTMDWTRVGQIAQAWNASRCAYMNLRLARDLLNANVPDDWLSSRQPRSFDPRFYLLAQELVFQSADEPDTTLSQSPKVVQFWAERAASKKIALLWRRIFPSRQVMSTIYPASSQSLRIFLYYPVRLKDLLRQHGPTAWRLFRRHTKTMARADRQNQVNALREWMLSG